MISRKDQTGLMLNVLKKVYIHKVSDNVIYKYLEYVGVAL